MKELFLSIQQRLVSEVSQLRYIDENWGQIDYYAPQPPVQYPLALIDLSKIAWSNIGQLQQKGQGEMQIIVANLKLGNTSVNAPQEQKDIAYFVQEVIQSVHLALHGWQPIADSSRLTRTATERIIRDDGIQEFRINYAIVLQDNFKPLHQTVTGSKLSVSLSLE